MPNIAAAAARMLHARRAAERAAGRLLVEMIEAGAPIADILTEAGTVRGTDRDPRSLIHFSRVAKARRSAALAKIA